MIVECLNCKSELEIPDSMCEDGMRFECEECSTRFSYYNGQIFALKDDSQTGIPQTLQHDGAPDLQTKCSQMKESSSNVQTNSARKTGLWWGIIGAVILVLAALVASVFVSCYPKNEFAAKWKRLQKLEERYGTNNVKYVEARLDLIRNFSLVAEKSMVEKHRAFMDLLNHAGYMVANQEYANHTLVSLLVINTDTGACGFMRKGISDGQFSYPRWLSPADAQMIWRHFYYENIINCETNLENTERLIETLEQQLRQLKSKERTEKNQSSRHPGTTHNSGNGPKRPSPGRNDI